MLVASLAWLAAFLSQALTAELLSGQPVEANLTEPVRYRLYIPKDYGLFRLVVIPCGVEVSWTLSKLDRADRVVEGSGLEPDSANTTSYFDDSEDEEEEEIFQSGLAETQIAEDGLKYGMYQLFVEAKEPTIATVYFAFGPTAKRTILFDGNGVRSSVVRVSQSRATVRIKVQTDWSTMTYRYCTVLSRDRVPNTLCEARAMRSAVKMRCRRGQGLITFGNLERDTKYHVTTFVIDRVTGLSRSFREIPFVTLMSTKIIRLPLDKKVTGSVYPTQWSHVDYLVEVPPGSSLFISVQPCQGPVLLNVTMGGVQAISKSVSRSQKIVVERAEAEVVISVVNPSENIAVFGLVASMDENKDPFPDVDFSTDLVSTKQSCTDIVLEWSVSNPDFTYCLHASREQPPGLDESSPGLSDDSYQHESSLGLSDDSYQCAGPPSKKMQKISCSKFDKEAIGMTNLRMGETIMDLIPNTTYRFDMHVSRGEEYVRTTHQSIWVRTKEKC